MAKLDGKTTLVTGGTSEIGLAAATARAKEGGSRPRIIRQSLAASRRMVSIDLSDISFS
jgi:NAD(P)-dependent dehydrogenase (short-subunit alcohol dehydrogenase family)